MKINELLFKFLFPGKSRELANCRAALLSAESTFRLLERQTWRPPARIAIAAEMTDAQIEDRLAGTHTTEPVKAILAKIGGRVIELADRSTDAPRGERQTRDGTIPAFTGEDRLHVAGGAAALAELLGELQALTKDREANS